MSINNVSYAEAAAVVVAPESSPGVQPTAGWLTVQPNKNGIKSFLFDTKLVARNPITAERQRFQPELVDADVHPGLDMDLTMDHVLAFGPTMMLTAFAGSGGTGVATFRPSARGATTITVPAGGALQQNTLIQCDGFPLAANNGLFVVGSGSTSASIVVASGAVDSFAAPVVPIVRVAGFRGASGDIQLTAGGNLTSTIADFTTMGLNVNQWIKIGGAVSSVNSFVVGPGSDSTWYARITRIAAHQLTLDRQTFTIGTADAGTGRLIDIYFHGWLVDVGYLAASYSEATLQAELTMLRIGAGSVTEFTYATGLLGDTLTIGSAQGQNLSMSAMFIGRKVTDPTTSRATGASTAALPVLTSAFNPASKLRVIRLTNAATNALAGTDVLGYSIEAKNNLTAQKVHGTLGNGTIIPGTFEANLSVDLLLTQDDAIKAANANTTLAFVSAINNENGGLVFDMPALKLMSAMPAFPANGAITISPKGEAFIDPNGRYTFGMSTFAFLPTN